MLESLIREREVPFYFFILLINSTPLSIVSVWGIIPFGQGLTLFDFSLGILYTLALSSLGVTRGLIEDSCANTLL